MLTMEMPIVGCRESQFRAGFAVCRVNENVEVRGASWLHRSCTPLVAEILRPRVVALVVAAVGAGQLLASSFHVGWPCPFLAITGLPCPGCGLTRSVLALMHGHAADSLRWHAFGPLLFAGLVTSLAAAAMPAMVRGPVLKAIAAVESKVPLGMVLLILFGIFWLARLSGLLPLPASPDWHIPLNPA